MIKWSFYSFGKNMIIDFNNNLQPNFLSKQYDISEKARSIAYNQHPLTQEFVYQVISGKKESNLVNPGLLGLISHCYSNHLPLSLAPHDFWIVFISEIAKEVSTHSQQYRHLFTKNDEKELIAVPSNSLTEMPIGMLAEKVSGKVLFNSDIIFPSFKEITPIVKTTMQAIFCDMASPYYDYAMYLCGLPKIELRENTEEWKKLKLSVENLVEIFNTPQLQKYKDKLIPLLNQFISTSEGNIDKSFWLDIFTQKNVGSGNTLQINGWITQLFMKKHQFNKIENFTANHGVVKYTQLQTKKEFVAVYGGYDMNKNKEGFYELIYDKVTLEKVANKYYRGNE